MVENDIEDGGIQGLTKNWEYRVLSNTEIVQSLLFKRKVVLTDAHCICSYDQYGGAVNPKCLIHG